MLSFINDLFCEQQSFVIKSCHFVPYSITYTQEPRVEYKRNSQSYKMGPIHNDLAPMYVSTVDYVNTDTVPHIKLAHYILTGDNDYSLKLSPEQYTMLFTNQQIEPVGKTIRYFKWLNIICCNHITGLEIIED